MKKTAFLSDESHAKLNPNMTVYANPNSKKKALAIEIIEKYGLPPQLEKPKKIKKKNLSPLQNELLTVYTFDPTEQQMQELKAFLQQLFADKINTVKENKVIEMAA